MNKKEFLVFFTVPKKLVFEGKLRLMFMCFLFIISGLIMKLACSFFENKFQHFFRPWLVGKKSNEAWSSSSFSCRQNPRQSSNLLFSFPYVSQVNFLCKVFAELLIIAKNEFMTLRKSTHVFQTHFNSRVYRHFFHE